MARLASPSVIRQLESLFDGGSVAGLSDRQLLERYTAGGRDPAGEAAFAALVARHGPMVLGVCRQLLGDAQHAEDTFQAVFVVLAQKARSIRDPDLLGNWLYGVAIRTARCARQQIARRRRREEGGRMRGPGPDPCGLAEATAPPADRPAIDREQAEAIHGEVDRLPRAFRLPVVLCYFEGLTLDEAARRLRCPAGTLRSRLARARDRLQISLARRGVALPAAALGAILAPRSASASISPLLCDSTARAAIGFAAGQAASPLVASLAHEVLRSMFVNKLRLIATTLLVLTAVATGAGYFTFSLASQDEPKPQPANPRPQLAARPDDTTQRPAPGRMFVVGRVLDPAGKPVPGATIMVHARSLALGRAPYQSRPSQIPIGDARADGSGRFRIDAPRTSSSHHEAFGAVALAPGYGAGWLELDPDDEQPTADIVLRPEQVTHGRLFDLQGRPVPDVTLSVSSIFRVLPQAPARVGNRFDGVRYGETNFNNFPAWPKPVTTGPEGRFTLRGVSGDLGAVLTVHHPRFALQTIRVETGGDSESKPLTAALVPAQILTGRVTYADTGRPVPHAPLEVSASRGRVAIPAEFETDDEGRFRMNPPPADRSYRITAFPPQGQPYLIAVKRLEWPKGALEQSLDLALARGVLIHGKVTEEGSGKPVTGATVDFFSHGERQIPEIWGGRINTASDGSYQFGAAPSAGYLLIKGPSDDYVFHAIGSRMVEQGQPGGHRIYSHAQISLDLKPGIGSQEVNPKLRRAATVTGHVVGPDGQPVRDAWMLSRIILDPRHGEARSWTGRHHGNVRNGRFEIHGLDPDTEVPVYFLEPKRKLGATVRFSGKPAGEQPIVVKLEPCATATARLVGPDGKPIGGFTPRELISMVVTPGGFSPLKAPKDGTSLADQAVLIDIDPINYPNEPASDAQGRIVFPALVPGSTYRLVDRTPARIPEGPQLRKEFTVKPGETLDLGDIVIKKPQP